jgi:hypothetical protein
VMISGKPADCISVHLSNNDTSGLPAAVTFSLPNGKSAFMPVTYEEEVSKPRAFFFNGDSAVNTAFPDSKGIICCRLKKKNDNNTYLLTCSHVLQNGNGAPYEGNIAARPAVALAGNLSGKFAWGLRDNCFDIGLVLIDNNTSAAYQYKDSTSIPSPRATVSDDMLMTRVRMFGKTGEVSNGVIINFRSTRPILIGYKDGDFPLTNLILISKDVNNRVGISSDGDSGALVVDNNNRAIGMVVAGNEKFTYLIPMSDIARKLKATIL